MKSIYALIAACSLCFVCVACEDDIPDQTHEPQIHKIVGNLHEELSTKSASCASMLDGINTFAKSYDTDKGKEKSSLASACIDYLDAKKEAGSLENLATRLTNSGYYMVALILIDRYHNQALNCRDGGNISASDVGEKYRDLFDDDCEQVFDDAKEIAKKYSAATIK